MDRDGHTRLLAGKYYRNGRGDLLGPMLWSRSHGCFLDQHAVPYNCDGKQLNPLDGSTANIVREEVQ